MSDQYSFCILIKHKSKNIYSCYTWEKICCRYYLCVNNAQFHAHQLKNDYSYLIFYLTSFRIVLKFS